MNPHATLIVVMLLLHCGSFWALVGLALWPVSFAVYLWRMKPCRN